MRRLLSDWKSFLNWWISWMFDPENVCPKGALGLANFLRFPPIFGGKNWRFS
jgi:hypothetical protein